MLLFKSPRGFVRVQSKHMSPLGNELNASCCNWVWEPGSGLPGLTGASEGLQQGLEVTAKAVAACPEPHPHSLPAGRVCHPLQQGEGTGKCRQVGMKCRYSPH